jgi:hypothetical protein
MSPNASNGIITIVGMSETRPPTERTGSSMIEFSFGCTRSVHRTMTAKYSSRYAFQKNTPKLRLAAIPYPFHLDLPCGEAGLDESTI